MIFKYNIKTNTRNELIEITDIVQKAVTESRINEGMCYIFAPHTTVGITINENADPSVKRDILYFMNKLIPNNENFQHMEGNSDTHLKSSIFGCSENIIVEDGRLLLGTWQGIYFCEFDGPRNRKVYIKITEE